MLQDDLLIGDLAQRAGVSVRTIRYYINEGLLPPPEVRGRYTYYSDNYLYRLELIRRLKDAFLPLKEIRQRMMSLNDEEVREFVLANRPVETYGKKDQFQISTLETSDSKSSALEYIDHILTENSSSQAFMIQPAPAPSVRKQSQPFNTGINENLPSPKTGTRPAEETWQHVIIVPGIELHFRLPLPTEYAGRIQQAIQKVQELLR
jgi:DNA-binding transcriptional MerR regulator